MVSCATTTARWYKRTSGVTGVREPRVPRRCCSVTLPGVSLMLSFDSSPSSSMAAGLPRNQLASVVVHGVNPKP